MADRDRLRCRRRLSLEGGELLLYLGLGGVLLVVVDRFATLSHGLSAYCVPRGGAGTGGSKATPLTDPVAREFAHVRREGTSLAVASISVPEPRGASRRLARVARELLPDLRRTDVIVRAVEGAPGAWCCRGAMPRLRGAVLRRCLGERARRRAGSGSRRFPEDGPTFAALKEAAQSREQPWPGPGEPPADAPPPPSAAIPPEPGPIGAERAPGGARRVRARRPVACARLADLLVLVWRRRSSSRWSRCSRWSVKLDSPGPAFVRIRRLGRDGRPFELLKLRSMTRDADRRRRRSAT